MNEILRYDSIQSRVNVIYYLLQCGFISHDIYSNFELIEVIFLSLRNQPIYRLKQTFAAFEELYPSQLANFENITGSRCQLLKKKSLSCSYPLIPYIGSYCMDIRKIDNFKKTIEITERNIFDSDKCDNNIETKDNKDSGDNDNNNCDDNNQEEKKEKIIWEKNNYLHLNMIILRSQDRLFREIQRAQETPYRFRWNEKIHNLLEEKFLNPSCCLDDDGLEKKSRRLEAEVKEGVFEI